MNVNEPHVCSRVMGKNRSLLATTTTHSTSPNTYSTRAFFASKNAYTCANAFIAFLYFLSLSDTCTYTHTSFLSLLNVEH